MLLEELLRGVPVIEIHGERSVNVSGLAYDSRQVDEGFLFVAVKGFQTDGHLYIPQAMAAGAMAVVAEKKVPLNEKTTLIVVEDSRAALSRMAANYYVSPSDALRVVGVTGTNGKTTIAHLVAEILQAAGNKTGMLGTVSQRIGNRDMPATRTTPESLDMQRLLFEMKEVGCTYAVMEVSSHALALKRVQDVHFDVGVFSNLTQDHLDFHADMEDYYQAKAGLFRLLARKKNDVIHHAVVNVDDPYGKRLLDEIKVPVISYGCEPGATLRALNIQPAKTGTSVRIRTGAHTLDMKLKLRGAFNAYNALAALGVALGEGMDIGQAVATLETASGVPGRMETIELGQDFTVLVDYAHTPDGVQKVLEAARGLGPRRLTVVFGCGGDRDPGKRPLMGRVASLLSDYCIITSDNPRSEDPGAIIDMVRAGMVDSGCSWEIYPDRSEAILRALEQARRGDVVVVAGKGHETYQEISGKRIPFDDRLVAKEALRGLGYGSET